MATITIEQAKQTVGKAARGQYQFALLTGGEAWSGATLRGTARKYGGVYARSRRSLLSRLRLAGLAPELRPWGHNGRLILTVRTAEGRVAALDL